MKNLILLIKYKLSIDNFNIVRYTNHGDKLTVFKIIELLQESILNGTYDMVSTEKNRNSRRKYGLTIFEIEDFLKSIDVNCLIKGPEPDRDIPGEEVFVFKKKIIKGVNFYIKIKKDNTVNYNRIKILSCHEDEN